MSGGLTWYQRSAAVDPGGLGGSLQQPDEVAEVRHSTYQDGRWLKK